MRLAVVAEHPADRLADEELALLEHRVGVAGEPGKVVTRPQRRQLRQERRAPHPVVRVARPVVKLGGDIRMSDDQAPGDTAGQGIDERPRFGVADERSQERQVTRSHEIGARFEREHGGEPAVVWTGAPQRPDERDELVVRDVRATDDESAHRAPIVWDRHPKVHPVAPQIPLLSGRSFRVAEPVELTLEIASRVGGVECHPATNSTPDGETLESRRMEVATTLRSAAPDDLPSDKAARIVEAMRISVGARGIAGATFDHVAREAGVSRGLLHYYFGTKERLLVEVVRRESDVRIEQLETGIAGARSADEVIETLLESFEEFSGKGSATAVMFYEMATLAQRNVEIATELAELGRRTRSHLADALRAGSEAGVLSLRADADDIATWLFALADGMTLRLLVEPDHDISGVIAQAVTATRALLR